MSGASSARPETFRLESDVLEAEFSEVGASILSLRAKTPAGKRDLILPYASASDRLRSGSYGGAIVGRVANRIGGASFMLNGKRYPLSANDGKNTLHGGERGFDTRIFSGEKDGDTVSFMLVSENGDQGFPGNLCLVVKYTLIRRSLLVSMSALSDMDTPFAPAFHPYFTLGTDDIRTLELTVYADCFTPMDEEQIPTGAVEPVEGTPLDFRTAKPVGRDFDLSHPLLSGPRGYDHNFVLKGNHAATLSAPGSAKVDIYTDLPGLHVYSGNFLKGPDGKTETPYAGLALEAQFFPNAVNLPAFPSPFIPARKSVGHTVRFDFEL